MDRNEPFSCSRTVTNYQVGFFLGLDSPHWLLIPIPNRSDNSPNGGFSSHDLRKISQIDSTNISQNILDLGSHAPIFFEAPMDTIHFLDSQISIGLTPQKKDAIVTASQQGASKMHPRTNGLYANGICWEYRRFANWNMAQLVRGFYPWKMVDLSTSQTVNVYQRVFGDTLVDWLIGCWNLYYLYNLCFFAKPWQGNPDKPTSIRYNI